MPVAIAGCGPTRDHRRPITRRASCLAFFDGSWWGLTVTCQGIASAAARSAVATHNLLNRRRMGLNRRDAGTPFSDRITCRNRLDSVDDRRKLSDRISPIRPQLLAAEGSTGCTRAFRLFSRRREPSDEVNPRRCCGAEGCQPGCRPTSLGDRSGRARCLCPASSMELSAEYQRRPLGFC